MPVINPIISDALKSYFQEHTDIPPEMEELVKKLLRSETNEDITKEGLDKVYDQILQRFISNESLVKWSENYVH